MQGEDEGLIPKFLKDPVENINSLNQIMPKLIADFQDDDESNQLDVIT